MNIRKEYEMTEKDLQTILEACKPTPATILFGSLQQNANNAWENLGIRMGFDYMSVEPIEGKNNKFFSAIPNEVENER